MKEPKIKKQKTYMITTIDYVDGTSKISRTNDGFEAIELLGLCRYIESDILDQMAGKIKPTIVERNVIVNNEK